MAGAELATVQAVKALVYDAVFHRAQEIEASDKLRNVSFEGEAMSKGRAECLGSTPSELYTLGVAISGESSATPAVGHCSCPAGQKAKSGLCKHGVALLLRRVLELGSKFSGHFSQEEVVSIATQVDEDPVASTKEFLEAGNRHTSTSQTQTESANGGAHVSTDSRPKRSLPAWMLGVVGSAVEGEPSNASKSRKRAAALKPPRPPPTKRARRSGKPLKITNDFDDEEDEDPGEVVEDAEPIAEDFDPEVIEDAEVGERIGPSNDEDVTARGRRKLRILKNEDDMIPVGSGDGDEGVKRRRGRASSSISKAVQDQPVRRSTRRRLIKKNVDDGGDIDEAEAAPPDFGRGSNCLDLSDDELILMAQEQVRSEEAAKGVGDLRLDAQAEPLMEKKPGDNSSQGKKSIFSMNKWKEMSSEGAKCLATDLDMETLKNYSLGPKSDTQTGLLTSVDMEDAANGFYRSSNALQGAKEVKHPPVIFASASDQSDAVANDMLDLLFGPMPSTSVAAEKTTTESFDNASRLAPVVGSPCQLSNIGKSLIREARTDIVDLTVESKPKKKGSLKDKVKMFLS